MSKKRAARKTDGRSRSRTRGTPRWLATRELDEMARRRCLLVLSVLSGERAVTDVLEEAQISRGTYYNMEERALRAMLAALAPSTIETPLGTAESPAKRIEELEAKVTQLEREKRRGERLLLLTRKVVRSGPMKEAAGRRPKPRRSSTTVGPKPSRGSKAATTPSPSVSPSTPTPDGEAAP